MTVNFCFDRLSDPDLGYPNLAQSNLSPDEFDHTWPRTLPVRLFAYFPLAGIRHGTWLVEHAPVGSWYPIGLAWHDFDCDYFALMPPKAQERVRSGEIKVLFYYHEGDNPERIKQHLDRRCEQHGFPEHCYVFVSANSAANQLDDFYYLPDHELFFRYLNRHQRVPEIPVLPRKHQFTAVNRSHKWWRATIMSDLVYSGVLERSLWSYNTLCDVGDHPDDNPLMLESIPIARQNLDQFMAQGPYWCDDSNSTQHNDHRTVNLDLFHDSYCHLIIETHFDADQSGGCFMTEKTYKCLKFGQPFVMLGTQHSLKDLRDGGYRVFDQLIDNAYDDISDNTQRYLAARKTIMDLANSDLDRLLELAMKDLVHNQQHFMQRGTTLLLDFMSYLSSIPARRRDPGIDLRPHDHSPWAHL